MEVAYMREKEIEQRLVKAIKSRGGLCIKLSPVGFDGLPDRLVLLPQGCIAFVELKALGKKPRALQIRRMKQLTELGFNCYVLDRIEGIGGVIDAIQAT